MPGYISLDRVGYEDPEMNIDNLSFTPIDGFNNWMSPTGAFTGPTSYTWDLRSAFSNSYFTQDSILEFEIDRSEMFGNAFSQSLRDYGFSGSYGHSGPFVSPSSIQTQADYDSFINSISVYHDGQIVSTSLLPSYENNHK